MRRVATSAVIFILMTIFCLTALSKMEHITQELLEMLDQIEESVISEDYTQAEKLSDEFTQMWHLTEEKLVLYIRHTPLDSISSSNAKMCIYIRSKDMSESLAELDSIRVMITHIYESELPKLNNIF